MAGQNVPLMLTQGITVTNDSLVHFMPDTTPRAAKKVYLVFLSLSAVWTLGVWGAAGELIHDLRSKRDFTHVILTLKFFPRINYIFADGSIHLFIGRRRAILV